MINLKNVFIRELIGAPKEAYAGILAEKILSLTSHLPNLMRRQRLMSRNEWVDYEESQGWYNYYLDAEEAIQFVIHRFHVTKTFIPLEQVGVDMASSTCLMQQMMCHQQLIREYLDIIAHPPAP